ncbi:hypothetical protein WJX74_004817 [Apatococcus lobatus]|uniref:Uncharacterized protein n=1 Tax=Apatococcus lobatus TaxID=904363 RepID=A0AAW1SA12_9CHLO
MPSHAAPHMTRQQRGHSRASEFSGPSSPMNSDDESCTSLDIRQPQEQHDFSFKWPADARAALKKDIDAFLVALPLGSTSEDARLEELVAGKLLEMGLAQASLQQKLTEWSHVANDLRGMVHKQQEQLRGMQGVGNAGGEPVSPSIALQPRHHDRLPAGFQALASIRQSQDIEEFLEIAHQASMSRPSEEEEHLRFQVNELEGRLLASQKQLEDLQCVQRAFSDHQDIAALEGTRQLQGELRSARAAAAEAGDAAKVAQAEAQRLRKTLINAEMELQQASVTNDDLRRQLQDHAEADAISAAESEAIRARDSKLLEYQDIIAQLEDQLAATSNAGSETSKRHAASVSGMQHRMDDALRKADSLSADLVSAHEQLSDASSQRNADRLKLAQMQHALTESHGSCQHLQQQLGTCQDNLTSTKQALDESEADALSAKQELESQAFAAEEKLCESEASLKQLQADHQADSQAAQQEISSLAEQIQQLQQDLDAADQEANNRSVQLGELHRHLEAAKEVNKDLQSQVQRATDEAQQAKSDAGDSKEHVQAVEQNLQQLEGSMVLLRAEAQLKAQAEQAQLARARGLVGECSLLERQVDELRDAAKRADLRHQTQAEEAHKERQATQHRISVLKKQVASRDRSIEDLHVQLKAAANDLQTSQGEAEGASENVRQLTKELDKKTQQIQATEDHYKKGRNHQIEALRTSLAEARTDLEDGWARHAQEQAHSAELQLHVERLEEQASTLEQKLSLAQNDLDVESEAAASHIVVEELHDIREQLEDRATSAEQEHARSSEMAEALMEQLEAAAQELEASDQRAQANHEQASQAEMHLTQASERIEELEDAAASLSLEKDELASQLAEANNEAARAAESAAELGQQINVLTLEKDRLTLQLEEADAEGSRLAEALTLVEQQLATAVQKLQLAESACLEEQDCSKGFKATIEQMEQQMMEGSFKSSMHEDQLVQLQSLLEQQLERHQAEVAQIQEASSREVQDVQSKMQKAAGQHQEAIRLLQHAHEVALQSQAAELVDVKQAADEEAAGQQPALAESKQAFESQIEMQRQQLSQAESGLSDAAAQKLQQNQAIIRMQLEYVEATATAEALHEGQMSKLKQQHAEMLADTTQQMEKAQSTALSQLQQDHAQEISDRQRHAEEAAVSLKDALCQKHADAIAELQREHAQDLANAMSKASEIADGRVSNLKHEHGTALTHLEEEHGRALAAEAQWTASLQASLQEQQDKALRDSSEMSQTSQRHAAAIAALQAEQAHAIQDQAACFSSRVSVLEEQHAAALAEALQQTAHAHSHAQNDRDRQHSAALEQMQQCHAEALTDALHEANAVSSKVKHQMEQDHAAAFAELRQELDAGLDALRNDGIQHERSVRAQLEAKHADALAAQRAEHVQEVERLATSALHPDLQDAYASLWARQTVRVAVLKACWEEASTAVKTAMAELQALNGVANNLASKLELERIQCAGIRAMMDELRDDLETQTHTASEAQARCSCLSDQVESLKHEQAQTQSDAEASLREQQGMAEELASQRAQASQLASTFEAALASASQDHAAHVQALERQHQAELMQARAEASLSAVSSPWLTPLQLQLRSSQQEASSASFKPAATRYGHSAAQQLSSDHSLGSTDQQGGSRLPSDALNGKQQALRHEAACLRHPEPDGAEASCSSGFEDMPEIHSPVSSAPQALHADRTGHQYDVPPSSSSPEILCAQQASHGSQSKRASHTQQLQESGTDAEELQDEVQRLHDELGSARVATLDCQEMLEELQAFSEQLQQEHGSLKDQLQDCMQSQREAAASLVEVKEALRTANRDKTAALQQLEALQGEAERLEAEAHAAAQELALRDLDCSALRGQLAATHEAAGASMRRVEALSSELARSHRSREEAEGQVAAAQQETEAVQQEASERLQQLASQLQTELRRRAEAEARAQGPLRASSVVTALAQEQQRQSLSHLAMQQQRGRQSREKPPESPGILGTLSEASLTPASTAKQQAAELSRPRAMRSLEFLQSSSSLKENCPGLANLPAGSPVLRGPQKAFDREASMEETVLMELGSQPAEDSNNTAIREMHCNALFGGTNSITSTPSKSPRTRSSVRRISIAESLCRSSRSRPLGVSALGSSLSFRHSTQNPSSPSLAMKGALFIGRVSHEGATWLHRSSSDHALLPSHALQDVAVD